jgi:uncharacterized protein (DUF305 family)
MIRRKTLFWGTAVAGLLPLSGLLAACGGQTQNTAIGDPEATINHGEMMNGHGMMHDMDLGPADATYDLRFIDAMILHHEGAIVMAEEALEKSERAEIRQLATEIIAEQEREIAQMREWRQAWYPDALPEPMMHHAEMGHDMPMSAEMAAAMRMDMDLGPADAEFDLRFINAMIPHHEGAVQMAEDLREKSDRSEMQALADDIISAQQAEIDQMEAWRQDWYGQ